MKQSIQLLLFSALLLLPLQSLKAQDFHEFYQRDWDIHAIKSFSGHYGIGFQYASAKEGMFKGCFEYQNLFLEDLVPEFMDLFNTGSTMVHPERISNIWGSLSFGLNVVATERLTIAVGISGADYYVRNVPFHTLLDPDGVKHGWYYVAGSLVRADVLLSDKFMLRFRNNITPTLYDSDMKNNAPFFVKTGLEIVSVNGLFFGAEYISMTNFYEKNVGSVNLRLGIKIKQK